LQAGHSPPPSSSPARTRVGCTVVDHADPFSPFPSLLGALLPRLCTSERPVALHSLPEPRSPPPSHRTIVDALCLETQLDIRPSALQRHTVTWVLHVHVSSKHLHADTRPRLGLSFSHSTIPHNRHGHHHHYCHHPSFPLSLSRSASKIAEAADLKRHPCTAPPCHNEHYSCSPTALRP
jgi:hypothetical protein